MPPLTQSDSRGSGHLSKLIDEIPKFKSAQIRHLWPKIKAALEHGHKLKRIWECLGNDGIQLSYGKFRWYVARLKRLESEGADLSGDGGEASRMSSSSAPNIGVQVSTGKRDPLANLRERTNKRPGFEFDERPPDVKKLI